MLYVNLLPWRSTRLRQQQRRWLRNIIVFITLAVTLMFLWCLTTQHALQVQHSDMLMLTDSHTRLTLQLKKVSDTTQQLHDLQRAAREYDQRRNRSLGYLSLLTSMAGHIPDNVWLTELSGEPDGRIQLRGESAAYQAIMTFAQVLKEDALFSDVRLLDIQRLPAQSFHFAVQLRLVQQPGAL